MKDGLALLNRNKVNKHLAFFLVFQGKHCLYKWFICSVTTVKSNKILEIIQEGISHSANSLQTGLQHVFEMSSVWKETAHGAEMSLGPLCNSQIPLAIIPPLAQRSPTVWRHLDFPWDQLFQQNLLQSCSPVHELGWMAEYLLWVLRENTVWMFFKLLFDVLRQIIHVPDVGRHLWILA